VVGEAWCRRRSRPCGDFVEFEAHAIEQSIPDRFEQQVDRDPDKIAVRTRNDRLTYAELDAWANRIALAILEQSGEGQEPVRESPQPPMPPARAGLRIESMAAQYLQEIRTVQPAGPYRLGAISRATTAPKHVNCMRLAKR
jgi:non-ribosomal peptide synthetase component F